MGCEGRRKVESILFPSIKQHVRSEQILLSVQCLGERIGPYTL